MFRYLMVVTGLVQMALAAHLHIYYLTHAKKIHSRYFKDLAMVFLSFLLMGSVWAAFGSFLLVNQYGTYEMYIPEITVIFSTINAVVLLNFVYSTNSAANGSKDLDKHLSKMRKS